MQAVLIYAFAAAVLGGLESPVGAVIGGLALGVLLDMLGTYVHPVTPELRLPVALADPARRAADPAGGALRPRRREARVKRFLGPVGFARSSWRS